MKKVYKKPSLVAYRRGANLANVVIHGKLNKMLKKEDRQNTVPCGEESCKICPMCIHQGGSPLQMEMSMRY